MNLYAFVLMLRPFFPELVMSTDLLSFEHPAVLLFCFIKVKMHFKPREHYQRFLSQSLSKKLCQTFLGQG